eukprot:10506159-Alexandrium_andersonii.AAC.1
MRHKAKGKGKGEVMNDSPKTKDEALADGDTGENKLQAIPRKCRSVEPGSLIADALKKLEANPDAMEDEHKDELTPEERDSNAKKREAARLLSEIGENEKADQILGNVVQKGMVKPPQPQKAFKEAE